MLNPKVWVATITKKLTSVYKLINKQVRRFRREIYLLYGKLRLEISLKQKNKRPILVLNARYEKPIKTVSRIILALSVLLSFLSFPQPYSAIVSLALIALEQLIERVVYSLIHFLLSPFPDYDLWKKADFAAMMTIFEEYKRTPAKVGMYFRDTPAGTEVFEYIRKWNYDNDEDLGKNYNIQISFVIDKKRDRYAFFAFPSINRPSLTKMIDDASKEHAERENIVLTGQMIMCKLFNFSGSGFQRFAQQHDINDQYFFTAYSGSPMQPVEIVKPILKNKLKIVDRKELTDKDLEKYMCDFSINWDDEEKTPPSMFFVNKSPL